MFLLGYVTMPINLEKQIVFAFHGTKLGPEKLNQCQLQPTHINLKVSEWSLKIHGSHEISVEFHMSSSLACFLCFAFSSRYERLSVLITLEGEKERQSLDFFKDQNTLNKCRNLKVKVSRVGKEKYWSHFLVGCRI